MAKLPGFSPEYQRCRQESEHDSSVGWRISKDLISLINNGKCILLASPWCPKTNAEFTKGQYY